MGSLRADRSSLDAARFATAKTMTGPALSNRPPNKSVRLLSAQQAQSLAKARRCRRDRLLCHGDDGVL